MLSDPPGDQVVDADDAVALGEQALAEVRAEEAGAAGDERSGHDADSTRRGRAVGDASSDDRSSRAGPVRGSAVAGRPRRSGGRPPPLPSARRGCAGRRSAAGAAARPELIELELPELVPLGGDDHAVGALGRFVGVGAEGDLRQQRLAGVHRRRIVGAHGAAAARAAAARSASAGDSRMSSVSALNDRPRTAAVAPASRPNADSILSSMRRCVWSLTASTASMMRKLAPVRAGDVRHRAGVLGEAGAAEPGAGVQELVADARCRAPCPWPPPRRRRRAPRTARPSR